MADVDTSKTMIMVGWILQINVSAVLIILGSIAIIGILNALAIWGTLYLNWLTITLIIEMVMGIVGLIFVPLWRRWGEEPFEYRQNLITTGVIAIFGGVIGGLLVLIGAAMLSESDMAPIASQPTYVPAATQPEPQPEVVQPKPEPETVRPEPEPEAVETAPADEGPAEGMKTCPNCSAPLEPDAKFCTNCGNQL